MAEFKVDDVITKIRELKLNYIQNNVGSDPAQLPNHFAEFLGYATLLYDHYATALRSYRQAEAKVLKEEAELRIKMMSDTLTLYFLCIFSPLLLKRTGVGCLG